MPFEILHGAFVLFGLLATGEGTEVAALAGGGVLFAGIETIFAGFEPANHTGEDAARRPGAACDTAGLCEGELC